MQFFYSVGKKRYECEKQCVTVLLPLLHAIKLLVHETTIVTPMKLPTLKISGRLAFVATIYKSLDLIDESILATMLALLYDSIEVSIAHLSTTDKSYDIIMWLSNLTENVVVLASTISNQNPLSEQRLGLQSSLLQLLMKHGRSNTVPESIDSSKISAMNPSAFVDLLLDSLDDCNNESFNIKFEEHCNVPFNLGTMLPLLITNKAIPRRDEFDKYRVIMEYVKLMTELIVRFGHLLQCHERDVTDSRAASINDYYSMCRFTESLISKLIFDDSLPLALSMMNLVASISLVSAHPTFKFDDWMADSFSKGTHRGTIGYIKTAKMFADKGYSTLEGSNACDSMSFATLTAIDLYRYQLSRLQAGESHHIDMRRLQEFYDRADFLQLMDGNKTLSFTWQFCIINTLSRLCMQQYLEGEELHAVQIASWICSTAREVGKEASVWFESILLTLISETSIVAIRPMDTKSFSHPVKFEEKACKLRLYARDADYSLGYIESHFQSLLDTLHDSSSNFGSDFDEIVLWSKTTVYLGLSECAENQGCLESSMIYLKKCFEGCRFIVSELKRRKSRSELSYAAWYLTALTYISLSCLKRQVKCLYKTALLYHRMGNYRKSIEYSFTALNSPSLEEAGLTSKSTFAEAVSLARQCPARDSHETMVRRLYLRLKSLACSFDIVADQFQKTNDHLYLSLVDDGYKGINCELETIVDMYESKYCTFLVVI